MAEVSQPPSEWCSRRRWDIRSVSQGKQWRWRRRQQQLNYQKSCIRISRTQRASCTRDLCIRMTWHGVLGLETEEWILNSSFSYAIQNTSYDSRQPHGGITFRFSAIGFSSSFRRECSWARAHAVMHFHIWCMIQYMLNYLRYSPVVCGARM